MSSSYDAYSVQSVPSSSAAPTNKKRWRDMGLSGAASSGLANLLRSAKKSTDSLRSTASATSNRARSVKSFHSTSSEKKDFRLSMNKDLPPNPPNLTQRPDLQSRTSESSSAASRIIHDVPEEPPLEFYEMPPEAELDSNVKIARNNVQKSVDSGFHTPTRLSSSQDANTIDREQNNTTPTNESELRKREKISSKKPTITSRSASLNSIAQNMTPSRSLSYDADGTESQVNATSIAGWTTEHEGNVQEESGTKTPTNEDNQNKPLYEGNNESLHRLSSSAKSIARKSFTRIRRKSNASTNQDAAKAASAAVAANTDQPMPTSASNNVAAAAAKIAVGAGTQWAGNKNSGGDGNTIAQLYAVFGLPKDPSVWTIAEEDCVLGVHHAEGAIDRFWRPEVLGCSICPSPSEVLGKTQASSSSIDNETAASKWEGRSGDKEENTKKSQSPKFIEMNDGRGATEKAETARVLSKALKLSFTREVEIVAEQGHYPPKATSHTFSFSVPTIPASGESYERSGDGRKVAMATGVSVGMTQAANGVGEGYGLTAQRRGPNNAYGTNNEEGPRLATFYGVALTVWSAADEKRAKVIKKELQKAKKQNGTSLSKTESNDQDSGLAATRSSSDSVYFMPYAICIVSRFPLYNLLGDWNKMAWHKYSRNIEMHNQLMSTILRHPAPRLGEEISVGSPEKDLSFHCTFPGAVEWGTGMIGIDFTMWPLFNTLSLDNILTICEIALGHNGRILFISRHPALLGMAVETLRYIVEQNGWRGVVHQICHARDVRIYLEDPGSWIIGINAELRGLVHPPAQVCTVDLDLNRIACNSPPLNAISTKGSRERRKKRLQQAIQIGSFDYRPPREFVDAYPGGRFRPLSHMITRDLNSAYEQLPSPQWWNQVTIIQTFDTALREDQRSSLFKRMLKPRRNTVVASDAEIAAIMALRKRASTFVDARDGLENKIGRLNKRLAFLMSESEMWRAQFGKIQVLVDRLTKEANDLRSKVDKERRESKRLSSRLAQRDIEHVQIQLQLKDTEQAREEALGELLRMKSAMESVEQEREAMMDEIRAVLSGGGNIDDVNLSVSRLDLPSFNVLSRSSSPTGSQVSMTPSQAAEYVLKARAVAEARISEGRPGRTASRTNSRLSSQQGHRRSMSQDRAEREGRSYAGSTNSHANHFPDEQMNYEIQQRTNIVTDQISRIQQQLESTLTNLEGRRSGTYERETNRRQRRGSNASIGSRYEYRSSVGHGMQTNGDENSMNGHMSEDGRSDIINYEKVESVQERPARGQRRRRSAAPPTASSQSLREAYASSNASHTSLNLQPPALTPKSSSRPRISSINSANGVIGSVKKVQSPITSIRSPEAEVIPGPVAESISGDSTLIAPNVTTDSATLDGIKNNLNDSNPLLVTSVFSQEDMMNGVQAQPMLSVLNNSKANNETSESTAVEEIEPPIESQNQDAVQEVSTPFGVTTSVESASTIADKNNFNYSSPLFSMALERSDRKTSQDESRKTASGGTSPTLATGASFGTDADSLMTKNGWTVDTGNVKNVDELGGTNGDAITTSS